MSIAATDNLRERESLSLLKREREREEYHVARPHISLCSCVKQSEQWRGASTSESRGNPRTTWLRDRCTYAEPHRGGEPPAGHPCTTREGARE